MTGRRLSAVVLTASALLAGCSNGETENVAAPTPAPTVTVTVTTTATVTATPPPSESSRDLDTDQLTSISPTTEAGSARYEYLSDLLWEAPNLNSIVDDDLVTMGEGVCRVLALGGTGPVAAEAYVNGNAHLPQSDADELVAAAQKHLC